MPHLDEAHALLAYANRESAAFMACAHAKLTGKLGCCLATMGPGGVHLLNGLYDAKFDRAPAVALTGLPYHDLIGTFTQQDVNLDRLFGDVAHYTNRIMGPAHAENAAALACRIALTSRGVAHLSIPTDVQEEPLEKTMTSSGNCSSQSWNTSWSTNRSRGTRAPYSGQPRITRGCGAPPSSKRIPVRMQCAAPRGHDVTYVSIQAGTHRYQRRR